MLNGNERSSLVDILPATYNGDRYLCDLLDSLCNQTYPIWRLMISDDGSTDGTASLLSRYMRNMSNIIDVSPSIKMGSAKKNFLYLLSMSSSPYAIFCDQDDIWLPQKLEKSMSRMRELEEKWGEDVPLLVYSDSVVVDESLQTIARSFVSSLFFDPKDITLPQLLVSNVVQGCTMLMNRSLIRLALTLQDDKEFKYHDYLVAAVAYSTGYISFIEEPLMLYRQHGDNEAGMEETLGAMEMLRGGFHTVGKHKWREEVAFNETAFSRRARFLLGLGSQIPEDRRIQLNNMASFRDMKICERLSLIKRYGLLRQRGAYGCLCQLVGMLLA